MKTKIVLLIIFYSNVSLVSGQNKFVENPTSYNRMGIKFGLGLMINDLDYKKLSTSSIQFPVIGLDFSSKNFFLGINFSEDVRTISHENFYLADIIYEKGEKISFNNYSILFGYEVKKIKDFRLVPLIGFFFENHIPENNIETIDIDGVSGFLLGLKVEQKIHKKKRMLLAIEYKLEFKNVNTIHNYSLQNLNYQISLSILPTINWGVNIDRLSNWMPF